MTNRRFFFYGLWAALFFFAVMPGAARPGFSQDSQSASDSPSPGGQTEKPEKNPGIIKFQARAAEADALVSGKYLVRLWGIDAFDGDSALFKLKSRTALDNKIGNKPVQCSVKSRDANELTAQCVNVDEEDLSLYMLQQGYVSVDRGLVYGSLFENPYLQAENQAQAMKRGIWAGTPEQARMSTPPLGQGMVVGVVALLFMLVLALGGISVFIMRGFRNVVDVQNQSIDLAARERSLREKEKFVIASMLDAEIRTNKSKIEAYLSIYEEMLKDFGDAADGPKYKRSGDIVQKQPALSRSVFDGNTDKLDLLGHKMASDVIHYYARIKTIPDYVTLEPETPVDEARRIVGYAVEAARKLDSLSGALLDQFETSSLVQAPPES